MNDHFQLLPVISLSTTTTTRTNNINNNNINAKIILQITDLHHFDPELKIFTGPRTTVAIGNDVENLKSQVLGDYSTGRGLALVRRLVTMVQPDLVVFSGDIIDGRTCQNHIIAMRQVIEPCIENQIPWTFCPGNHDDDLPSKWSRLDLLQLYDLPCCASRGATSFNHSFRLGNDGPRIFLFDSHGSTKTSKNGITMKTIESYIDWSSTQEARRERDVDNVIGLAYFHIPLYEYAKKSAKVMCGHLDPMPSMRKLYKIKDDSIRLVGLPNSNTGLYDAMLNIGNIRSTFVGHDHYHDAILSRNDNGPWLCWGRVTSFTPPSDFEEAGGPLPFPRGGRVVKVENTHVETYVVNAEGIEEESRFELYDKSSVGSSNSKL